MALLLVNFVGAGNSLQTAQILLAAAADSNGDSTISKVFSGNNAMTVNKKTGLIFSISAPDNVWAQVYVLYL